MFAIYLASTGMITGRQKRRRLDSAPMLLLFLLFAFNVSHIDERLFEKILRLLETIYGCCYPLNEVFSSSLRIFPLLWRMACSA